MGGKGRHPDKALTSVGVRAFKPRSISNRASIRLNATSAIGEITAAVIATLIMTAKLNDVDPQAWLADVLARIADHPVQRLDELLPWHWPPPAAAAVAPAA